MISNILYIHVGDFTKSLVNNPPKTLWTRELKVATSLKPIIVVNYADPTFVVCGCIKHVDAV